MKTGPIDDLIGDAYAYLFSTIGQQLWQEERRIKMEEEANRPPPPVISPPRNPMMSLTHLMNVDGANDTAIPAAPPMQPLQTAEPTPDPAPARRKIGIGRREIRTTAEACFQKSNAGAAAASKPASRVEIVIESSRAHAGDSSADTSAPGSVHDSADDESELSELEEEGDEENEGTPAKVDRPRPMFPGLMAVNRMEAREASEGFETADEEQAVEDDNGDVDMDGEENRGYTMTSNWGNAQNSVNDAHGEEAKM